MKIISSCNGSLGCVSECVQAKLCSTGICIGKSEATVSADVGQHRQFTESSIPLASLGGNKELSQLLL